MVGSTAQCFALHRSIKKFTDEYKEKKYPIHVLLNNAAIQSPKGKPGAKTEDGFEVCACWGHRLNAALVISSSAAIVSMPSA